MLAWVVRLYGKPGGGTNFLEPQQDDILHSPPLRQKHIGLRTSRAWALLISAQRNISFTIHNYSPSECSTACPGCPIGRPAGFSTRLLVKRCSTVSRFTLHCQRPPSLNPGIFKYFMVQSPGCGRRLRHGTITVVSRTPPVEPCWLPKCHDSQTDRPEKTEECRGAHSSSVPSVLPASTGVQ